MKYFQKNIKDTTTATVLVSCFSFSIVNSEQVNASCFEIFFLLGILGITLDVVVLEESFLVLSFSKEFLVDLKISSELLECFAFV